MKFFNLFRKELKEMLTMQTIITMVVLVAVLYAAGGAISGSISESTENSKNIVICDVNRCVLLEYDVEKDCPFFTPKNNDVRRILDEIRNIFIKC